tara:strand:+ start:2812 stop:3201 length:390 start_codon:yes stop_codon:yes gene_type:complete
MIYTFRNTKTDEIKEVEMPMKDYKPYKGENGNEDFWERIYDIPQVNIGDSKTEDPFNTNSFIDKTSRLKGSYGDIMDYSAELSEKRAALNGGEDPIKRKHFDNYEKKTGKKHLKDKPKKIETKNATIEF